MPQARILKINQVISKYGSTVFSTQLTALIDGTEFCMNT
jgi:hypothetical protein